MFNQQITLPEGLTYLGIGHYFNKSVNFPNSITHLKFSSNFDRQIEIPNNITTLYIYPDHKDLEVIYNNKIIEIQDLPIECIDIYLRE